MGDVDQCVCELSVIDYNHVCSWLMETRHKPYKILQKYAFHMNIAIHVMADILDELFWIHHLMKVRGQYVTSIRMVQARFINENLWRENGDVYKIEDIYQLTAPNIPEVIYPRITNNKKNPRLSFRPEISKRGRKLIYVDTQLLPATFAAVTTNVSSESVVLPTKRVVEQMRI